MFELKNTSIYFGIVYFLQIQLAGLIETHLDLGPTTNWQVFKSAYIHKSCLQYSKRTALKHFVVAVA